MSTSNFENVLYDYNIKISMNAYIYADSRRGLVWCGPVFVSQVCHQNEWIKLSWKSLPKIWRSESALNCRYRQSCIKLTHTTWVVWEARPKTWLKACNDQLCMYVWMRICIRNYEYDLNLLIVLTTHSWSLIRIQQTNKFHFIIRVSTVLSL